MEFDPILICSIQPHYLLNSLHAITGWISKNPQKASDMVSSLSNEFLGLLKFSNEKSILVNDEIELCQSHLTIMSNRKLNDYQLKTENLDSTKKIPPLIFHTIIENGIKHELQGQESPHVSFFIRCDKNNVNEIYTVFCKGSRKVKQQNPD